MITKSPSNTISQFPQFTRIIHAWKPITLTTLLWAGCIVFVSINILASKQFIPILTNNRFSLLTSHNKPEPYIALADEYWKLGYVKHARIQLTLAQEVYEQTQTLAANAASGASKPPLELLSSWEGKPRQLTKEYEFWVSTLTAHPDYADAYVYAGALAWQLYKTDEAKMYIQKVEELNAYHPNLQPLKRLITESP